MLPLNFQNDIKQKNQFLYSIELNPPKNNQDLNKLLSDLEGQVLGSPLFYNVTCHLDTKKILQEPFSSLAIAEKIVKIGTCSVVLHLTCANKTKADICLILDRAIQKGIKNLFVVRGDFDTNKVEQTHFKHASDLVKYIRCNYDKQNFTIGVAGYPSKHKEALNSNFDLINLKHKIDCGADYIITQIVHCVKQFQKFVNQCRTLKINVPIIAGIMPICSYKSMIHMTRISGVKFPNHVYQFISENRDDKDKLYEFMIKNTVEFCKQLYQLSDMYAIHFCTMNELEITKRILIELNLFNMKFN